jgi:hypothetical protein
MSLQSWSKDEAYSQLYLLFLPKRKNDCLMMK